MPFLRLTRDRRGIENTFLLHADRAGARPRLLYWYRTAPGIVLGRPALDEEAIHAIEDSHPDIDFDWPAILALSEVMTPEDEAAPVRPRRKGRRERQDSGAAPAAPSPAVEETPVGSEAIDDEPGEPPEETPSPPGLLEELVGREIAGRLRARYKEIRALVYERETEDTARERRLRDIMPLDPDGWTTPEAVLDGVRGADELFERLRDDLQGG